jgi:hypothetical protein
LLEGGEEENVLVASRSAFRHHDVQGSRDVNVDSADPVPAAVVSLIGRGLNIGLLHDVMVIVLGFIPVRCATRLDPISALRPVELGTQPLVSDLRQNHQSAGA